MALPEFLRLQLQATRAQIDATLALEELGDDVDAAGEGCPHPTKARIPAAVMGKPAAWACGICGQVFEE